MLAAGLKKKKPSAQPICWRCSSVLRDISFRIARSRIPRISNSPFLLFFSGESSEDDDYTGPKATISIARPRIRNASRVDAENVLIVCILLLLVSVCPKRVGN